MSDYQTLILRNKDYIPAKLQDKIRACRLLIAGCGIGSSFAETAARLGFEHFILVDGDVVDTHNLNRQRYSIEDVDQPKVEALGRRIQAINPNATVEKFYTYLSVDNATDLVGKADVVFDTIDFLDLKGIVGLHDACRTQRKPVITALAIGWGAGCVYFPSGTAWTFRRLFGLPDEGSVENANYAATFAKVLERLAQHLDQDVVMAVGKALTVMEDGRPCPASQVAPGADAVGSLAGTLLVSILAGQPVVEAPMMTTLDVRATLRQGGIDLQGAGGK